MAEFTNPDEEHKDVKIPVPATEAVAEALMPTVEALDRIGQLLKQNLQLLEQTRDILNDTRQIATETKDVADDSKTLLEGNAQSLRYDLDDNLGHNYDNCYDLGR